MHEYRTYNWLDCFPVWSSVAHTHTEETKVIISSGSHILKL